MTSSPDAPAPRAVVVGHGDFAAGLVSAVEQITGHGALLAPVSNRDLAPADLEARLRERVEAGARIIFTDLPAGSTTMAARRLQRAHPAVVVVTGANLAALVGFVLAAPELDAAAAAALAVEKGRAAIAATVAPTAPAGG